MSQVRTIAVKPETWERLTELGRKGDTYDAIIRRLIARLIARAAGQSMQEAAPNEAVS